MNRFSTLDRPVEYEQISSQDFFGSNPFSIGASTSAEALSDNLPRALNWNESTEGDRYSQGVLPDEIGEIASQTESMNIASEVTPSLTEDIESPVSAALSAIGTGISIAEDQSASQQAIDAYTTNMATGHGLGFSQLADQNLKQTQSNVSSHQALTLGLTTLLGPAGAFISSLLAPSQSNDSTYNVNTTGGQVINAQDPQNAVTSSDITGASVGTN